MSGRRLLRLAAIVLAVVVLSAGTTLTAANIVPPSNAGMTSVPFLTACPFPVNVTFAPKNVNRNGPASQTFGVIVTLPWIRPPEYANAEVTSLALSLPGGTESISPQSDLLSTVFWFLETDLFDLVGSLHGNVTLEVSGMIADCRFTTQETIKIVGPPPK